MIITNILQKLRKNHYKILRYHSISNNKDPYALSPEIFKQEMQYLKENKFNVVSLQEFIQILKQNKRKADRYVVLTFDDGFKDHLYIVAPILKKMNFNATFFITLNPDKISKHQRRFLNKKEIKALASLGFETGNHTYNHSILTKLPKADAYEEIKKGKEALEKITGKKVTSCGFPGGAYNQQLIKFAKKTEHTAGIVGNALFKNEYDPMYLIRIHPTPLNKFKQVFSNKDRFALIKWQIKRFINDTGRFLLKDKWF